MTVTTTANWTPLETQLRSVGGHADVIREFMWMYGDEDARIQYYKHTITRRYLLLHEDGRCFQQATSGPFEVDFQKELQRVRGMTREDD